MTPSPSRRGRLTLAATALVTAALVPGLTQLPALGTTPVPSLRTADLAPDQVLTLGDPVGGPEDTDRRGAARPTSAQRAAASRLGAVDLAWNRFGTPSSILPADGVLARASSSDPVVAARRWIRDHRGV
ncbi:MAG TPA: peptidase M36, partial [Nocardioides sp.]|nr:peptidase M36 [Nocardioides sp.]